MAEDVFGNPSLFQEFEKTRDPSDTLLLKTLDCEIPEESETISVNGTDSGESDEHETGVAIVIGSSGAEDSPGPGPDVEMVHCESETVRNGNGMERSKSKRVPKKSQHGSNTSINNVNDTSNTNNILKEQIEVLKRENARLKLQGKIIDVPNEEGPAVQLIFLNDAFERKYRAHIEEFIGQLADGERRHNRTSTRNAPVTCCSEDCQVTGSSKSSDVDFVMDNTGSSLVNSDPSVSDGWKIPRYEQSFASALADEIEEEEDGGKIKEKRRKASCFNCGGDHIMSECTEKKDFSRIQRNRRDFQAQQGPRGPKYNRYHVGEARFSKFQPGVISDELRRALNIHKNQLPQFVYQMRNIGYPPGYLADTRVCTSGIAMFDGHGEAICCDGEDQEEGEIGQDYQPQKVEYDVSKIVDFPGFNVDPPKGTIDESRRLHMPPMKDCHRKDTFKAQLLNMSSGTKRSSTDEGGRRQKKLKTKHPNETEPIDMDLSSGTDDDLLRNHGNRSSGLRSGRLSSTTLEELEAKQAMLRRQLAAGADDSDVMIIDSSSDDGFVPPLPPTPNRPPLPPGTPPESPNNRMPPPPSFKRTPMKLPKPKNTGSAASTPSDSKGVTPVTPQSSTPSSVLCTPDRSLSVSMTTPSSGGSISMQYGTPIHDSVTEENLPDPSKFASCISEHIPFENLPGATGMYERVKRALKKSQK